MNGIGLAAAHMLLLSPVILFAQEGGAQAIPPERAATTQSQSLGDTLSALMARGHVIEYSDASSGIIRTAPKTGTVPRAWISSCAGVASLPEHFPAIVSFELQVTNSKVTQVSAHLAIEPRGERYECFSSGHLEADLMASLQQKAQPAPVPASASPAVSAQVTATQGQKGAVAAPAGTQGFESPMLLEVPIRHPLHTLRDWASWQTESLAKYVCDRAHFEHVRITMYKKAGGKVRLEIIPMVNTEWYLQDMDVRVSVMHKGREIFGAVKKFEAGSKYSTEEKFKWETTAEILESLFGAGVDNMPTLKLVMEIHD